MAIVLVGCESGKLGSPDSRSDSGSSPVSLGENRFSREVKVQFYDSVSERTVASPVARLDGQEFQNLKQLDAVRSQGSTNRFAQFLTVNGYLESEPIELVQNDPSGHQIAFAPRTIDDPNFGGVMDLNDRFSAAIGTSQLTLTYTLPEAENGSDLATLVTIGDGTDSSEFVSVAGNQFTVHYQDNSVPINETQVHYRWKVTVNGTVVEEFDAVAPYGTDGGPAFVSFRPPLLISTTPGLYTVHRAFTGAGGSTTHTGTYFQRKLVFENEFPEIPADSTDPVEIRNTFSWNDNGPLSNPSWTVENEDGSRKSGTDSNIEATWTPSDRVLEQSDEPPEGEGELEKVPFTAKASALAYDLGFVSIKYEISSDFELPGIVKIKIINPRFEPEPVFSDENPSATVKADIVLFDLDTPEEEVTWTVSILNPAGKIAWDNFALGSGFDVEATWDGTIDGVTVEDPSSYSFLIRAEACEEGEIVVGFRQEAGVRTQENEIPRCFRTKLEVPIGGSSGLVELFEEESGRLVASSTASPPEVLTFEPDSLPTFGSTASVATLARGSLSLGQPNNAFLQKIPGTDFGVIVAVSEVPDSDNLDKIVIQLKTTESSSGQSRNVELFPGTHPRTGERCFLRKILLSESNSGGNEPRFAIQPFAQSFSSFDATGSDGRLQDSERFIEIQSGLGRKQMGVTHDYPEEISGYQVTTPISVDAFRAAGYESLVATYEDEECWVRVRNQARLFYVSAHGLHDDNFIKFESGEIVYPSENLNDPNGLAKEDWSNDKLDTIILAACSVLDCGNWNQGHHGKDFDVKNPGRWWADITKPTAILLGYNAAAPDAEFGNVGAKRDTRIIELFYEQIGRGDHPTLAWLRANARMETRLGDNASAIFGNYYYFIKFRRKEQGFFSRGYSHTEREIWKVHYSYWNGDKRFNDIDEKIGHKIKLQDLPDQAEGEDHGAF